MKSKALTLAMLVAAASAVSAGQAEAQETASVTGEVIGDQPEPVHLPRHARRAQEDGEDADQLAAEQQRLTGKTLDSLALGPAGIDEPAVFSALQVPDLQRFERRQAVGSGLGDAVQRGHCGPLAPHQTVAVLEDDPPQPPREGGGLAQLSEVEVGVDERLLGGVASELRIPQMRQGAGQSEILEAPHEPRERGPIAVSRLRDLGYQLFVHPGPPCGRVHSRRPTGHPKGYRRLDAPCPRGAPATLGATATGRSEQ